SAGRALIQITEGGQRSEQSAGCATRLDKDSVELRGRRSFRRGDIQPEGQVPRGAARNGDLLILRAGGVIGANDDRVGGSTVRERPSAPQSGAGEDPGAGPAFKPTISYQLCSSTASTAGNAWRGG